MQGERQEGLLLSACNVLGEILGGHRKRIVIAGREGETDLETLDLGEVKR